MIYREQKRQIFLSDLCLIRPFREAAVEQKFVNTIFRMFRREYKGGSESSVIGVITLLIDIIGCCIIP